MTTEAVFKVDGVVFPVKEAWIIYDLSSYYCTIEVISERNLPISASVVLENESTLDLVVIGSIFTGDLYTHTLLTKGQWDLLNVTTFPVQGDFTIKKLLDKLGIAYSIDSDTTQVYWDIPELNYVTLLKHLNKYCPGSSPRFYIDLVGNFRMVDFTKSLSREPVIVGGNVKSDVTSLDWTLQVPQSVTFYSSSVEGYKKEVIENSKSNTKAKVFVNDTTGHLLDLRKRAYLNDFNYKFFTSRVITIDEITTKPCGLGDKAFVNEMHYGVVSYIRVPIYSITNYQLSMRVVCPA